MTQQLPIPRVWRYERNMPSTEKERLEALKRRVKARKDAEDRRVRAINDNNREAERQDK